MKIENIVTLNTKDIKALKEAVYILSKIDHRLWDLEDIKKIAYGEKLDNCNSTVLYDL